MLLAAKPNLNCRKCWSGRGNNINWDSVNSTSTWRFQVNGWGWHFQVNGWGWHLKSCKSILVDYHQRDTQELQKMGHWQSSTEKGQNKRTKRKSSKINGQVYVDLSQIVNPKAKAQQRRPNWCWIVHEEMQFKNSSFTELKMAWLHQLVKTFEKLERQWKIKTICMNNGGENKKLVKALNSQAWKLCSELNAQQDTHNTTIMEEEEPWWLLHNSKTVEASGCTKSIWNHHKIGWTDTNNQG